MKREERRHDLALHIRENRAELEAKRQPLTERESSLRRLGELKRSDLAQQLRH